MTLIAKMETILENTRALRPKGFIETLCESRAELGHQTGSYWEGFDGFQLLRLLAALKWALQSEADGIRVYRADETPVARLGVGNLDEYHPDYQVRLVDPRRSGFVMPTVFGVGGKRVTHAHLITEMEDGYEVILTFFPGDPLPPQPDIETTERTKNQVIRVREAMRMGFTYAMITRIDPLDL